MIVEESFRTLFDLAADAMFILDTDGIIKQANRIAYERLGYTKAEMEGKYIGSFILPEFAAMLGSRFAKIREQECLIYESAQVRKDGSVLPVEICSRASKLDGQKVIFSIVRDISERKNAESKSRASEEKWRLLFDNMTTGFALHDVICDEHGKVVDYRFLEANPAYEQLTGLKASRIVGRTVLEVLPGTEPYWIEIFGRVALSGEPTTYENFSKELGRWFQVRVFSPKIGQFAVIVSDITERKSDQRLLEMMKFSIDHMADKVTWVTSDAKVVYANIAACRSLGYTEEEMLKLRIPDFDPDFPAENWSSHWDMLKKLGSITFESRHRTKSGEIYPVEISINYMRFDDEEFNCGYARDISKRKLMEEALQLSSMILENSSEGMVVTDADNLIVAINPAFTNITGYSLDEVKGKNPRLLRSGYHDQAFYRAMWQAINTTGQWRGEIWDKRKDGEIHAKHLAINTIRNEDGSVHRYVALFSDVTDKTLSEEMIWRQANFDTLTGLPNRNMFRDRLEQEVKKSDREDLPLALLLIDLDQFKEVNDTLGHAFGDLLLKDAARRISSCVREADTVARLGGDEFTVVLSDISGTIHVDDVAQKIIRKLSEPFKLGNEVAYVSASVGITLYPADATDISTLMKNADQAMYVAKNKGRNRSSYFTTALQEAAQAKLRLTNDLRGALEANQFRIHYQPIVELSSGLIRKAEALIRWQHPERGMVAPMEFIPLAEETGLINEIGDWVFKESARWAKQWCSRFGDDFQVSVNKSPVQFRNENHHYVEKWFDHLRILGLSGKNMVIEITEGMLLHADTHVADELLRFRDAGINVAIDDFGTGYSSLSYLKKFDIDYLKIDRSFVNNLETDPDNMALSEAIIMMAHKLGLKVIAEGIETEGQRKLLAAAGCDYGQGYLFSRPVQPEEFERLILGKGKS